MTCKPSLRLGNVAKCSDQYQPIGLPGSRGKEVTVTRGEPLLRTPKLGMTYTLVDRTENKSGRSS